MCTMLQDLVWRENYLKAHFPRQPTLVTGKGQTTTSSATTHRKAHVSAHGAVKSFVTEAQVKLSNVPKVDLAKRGGARKPERHQSSPAFPGIASPINHKLAETAVSAPQSM
jgi:hypothetical protein